MALEYQRMTSRTIHIIIVTDIFVVLLVYLVRYFFSILVVISFINGVFDPENRTETKTKQVTSVEKSGDKITIYNSDSYKIVIDVKENTKNLYHNSEKLENVIINGYWDLRDNYQYIKSKDLLVNTDYTISKKGDVKSVFIEVVENKNKDDFKVEY